MASEKQKFVVDWTPDEKNPKELTIRFKDTPARKRRNRIMEIDVEKISPLKDLHMELNFYYGNFLRAKFKSHIFLGENILHLQDVKVEENPSMYDDDFSFLFNRMVITFEEEIKNIKFEFI